nr:MAG TPA: hypothetical protein [Caudoviricetes sp.]
MNMEEKINIAKILKDKPEGTKLWTDMFGEVTLYVVTNTCDAFQVKHHNKEPWFDKDGKLCKEGVLCIYPSKSMRDWEKFVWKKGDVLVNKDGNVHIIFDGFEDDTYKNFHGKNYLWEEGGSIVNFEEDEDYMQTSDFNKANKEDAQEYIRKIEKELGGKLNRETLEIEKTQPEFKDGDIVFMKGIKSKLFANCIFILRSEYKDGDERAFYYAFYNADYKYTLDEYGNTKVHYSLRLATDSEKQQLFDALSKKGKRWDAEKKEIVDLKPKVELKPFDKVLVKDNPYGSWEPALFWEKVDAIDLYPYMVIGGKRYRFCKPYKGNEHLLGTTNDVEG